MYLLIAQYFIFNCTQEPLRVTLNDRFNVVNYVVKAIFIFFTQQFSLVYFRSEFRHNVIFQNVLTHKNAI